jgi:hypothetical protein
MATTSATIMVRHCDCADGACTCVTHPFGDDRRYLDGVVAAGAARTDLDRLDGPSDKVVPVHPVLLKALTRAGFSRCEGQGDTLSRQQLDTLMSRAGSISDRIERKQLVGDAGIWPTGAR